MTNILKFLNKPEYLLQPMAILRRFSGRRDIAGGTEVVRLPWGLPIEVNTSEIIGRTISHHGLFEMSVVEAIFRLAGPGDIFLDIGANIGFMSSAAVAAGAKRIFSFEPHPELFQHLERNISLWSQVQPKIADRICARREAASDTEGTAKLRFPKNGFSRNNGLASLEIGEVYGDGYDEVEVSTTTLTRIIEQCGEPIGVLKIDIEGHELTAFKAGKTLLQEGRVRDIIYEDFQGLNSEVSQLLSSFGYSLFGLNKTLSGPVLLDDQADVTRFISRSYEGSYSFLATRDAGRARRCMSRRGYKCLKSRIS
jgi:FkbM family methyltransferase